jgi:hypothetical protein
MTDLVRSPHPLARDLVSFLLELIRFGSCILSFLFCTPSFLSYLSYFIHNHDGPFYFTFGASYGHMRLDVVQWYVIADMVNLWH